MEAAEFSGAGEMGGELEVGDIAALRAGLKNATGAVNRIGEGLTLADGEAAGFFGVDILAGFGGENGREGVPAVAGGDEDGVEIGAGQEVTEIPIRGAGLIALALVDGRFDGIAHAGLDVARGDEAHIGRGQHGGEDHFAAWADADTAEGDAVARGHAAAATEDVRGNDEREERGPGGGEGFFQERPAGGG